MPTIRSYYSSATDAEAEDTLPSERCRCFEECRFRRATPLLRAFRYATPFRHADADAPHATRTLRRHRRAMLMPRRRPRAAIYFVCLPPLRQTLRQPTDVSPDIVDERHATPRVDAAMTDAAMIAIAMMPIAIFIIPFALPRAGVVRSEERERVRAAARRAQRATRMAVSSSDATAMFALR